MGSENLEIFSTYLCSLSVDKGRIGVITVCKCQSWRVSRKNAKRIVETSTKFDRRLVLIK